MTSITEASRPDAGNDPRATGTPRSMKTPEHVVEIVSDSGEGAQKCGQIFGAVSAMMGNGVWTVEIIPAEIQPPPRSIGSASGNRVRIGAGPVTNWGDRANLVVAFNEQALLARHRLDAIADDAIVLLEEMWADHDDESIRAEWSAAMEELSAATYRIVRVPMEERCLTVVDDARKGKNMFVLGMLATIYARDAERTKDRIDQALHKKSDDVRRSNRALFDLGAAWAEEHLDFRVDVPTAPNDRPMVVMNGNQALGMGAIASGMDFLAMYPITPATSVSHYLAEAFPRVGGIVHQAEDEIAAVVAAIGASYAGKTAFTVTSGPGLALKTEALGLAVMTETPLVVIDVQRGGPSTGLPTKVEQSDLLAALFGQPGDTPKIVLAPATIEECFHCVVTARQIAEAFRTVVFVLSDANLATGVQPFPRPTPDPRWVATLPDQRPVEEGAKPYGWDERTGLSRRIVPGRPGGAYTTTGLAHDDESKIDYSPAVNEKGCRMRSRKLAVFQQTLNPPPIHGDDEGDLLVVGWGSTKGAIEEAVDRARADGRRVSSTHLTFLSPLEPGLKEMFARFEKVMTVEINYSDRRADPFVTEENRRRGQLCWLLRAQLLVDVDCWTRVHGQPLAPGRIVEAIEDRLGIGAES